MAMHGLTHDEVTASRNTHGANSLTKRKRRSWLRSFLMNFNDPMLKILLIALGINLVFIFNSIDMDHILETIGIAAAILIAVLVSTISEQGSEAAFEKLQKAASDIIVRVRRDGKTIEVHVDEVVVGDIVLLGSGDKIPADGTVISGVIEVDQSVLNGESKEAKKFQSANTKQDFMNENLLYSGTVVTSGEAVMRVTSVGDKTAYGKIAAELQAEQPVSPLKIKLQKLAHVISIIGYIGAVLVAAAYIINTLVINHEAFAFSHVLNAATLMVAVIVMAVPEGLPMMIAVVLSSNMKNMMKDSVLARKLNGIETAGSMNILFTDKTGTLTQGKLEVVEVSSENLDLMGLVLRYNTSAVMSDSRAVGGNFTDRILLEYSHKMTVTENVEVESRVPFSSEAKFMSTTLEDGRVLYKGAPEVILKRCTGDKTEVMKKIKELTAQAFRLIACAVDNKFVGIVAIRDQVRPEAVTRVKRLQSAGIQTMMITGDARETAVAVAREVGIMPEKENGEVVLTSEELNKMSDEELTKIMPKLRVVARALPSDKSRLVRITQSLGLVAGMTGDGVNDAPALKLADIGFAMGSGTEVAKEAGDIVIMDDNINSIARAASYGRTIFKSIRKFLIFKLTINFVAMAICIISPLIGVNMPITVLQMLWINIVMDTLAGLAYGGERPRESYMKEPPKRRNEPIINKYMWGQIIYSSIFIAVLSIVFLKLPLIQNAFAGEVDGYAMTAFFAFFMFINILNSFNSRTHEMNIFKYFSLNKLFILIMGIATVAQILLIFFGGSVFRTVPLKLEHFGLVLVLALSIIPVDLLRKLYIELRYGKNKTTT